MKKSSPAADPDSYLASLEGWQRRCVEGLREAVRASAALEEVVKWGSAARATPSARRLRGS